MISSAHSTTIIAQPSLPAYGSVIALAIFNTGIAFMVWLTLLLKVGATNTAQVTFIIPVVALILGVLILQESIEWNALIGLGFILLGLAIPQNRLGFGRSEVKPKDPLPETKIKKARLN